MSGYDYYLYKADLIRRITYKLSFNDVEVDFPNDISIDELLQINGQIE